MAEQSNLTIVTKVRGAGLMIPAGMILCEGCAGESKTCSACQGTGFVVNTALSAGRVRQ